MPPRSSWKGFIRLSLVSVPVKAYTATASGGGEIRLNQLHQDCHNRVKYQKVCPQHGEIANDEIVSGYEYSKGQYVVVDPDEIQKIRLQSDRSIHIEGFIPPGSLDARYHSGRTMYLVPDGPVGQKSYALLRQAMLDGEVEAFVRIILSGREQVALLRPLEDMLAVTVLIREAKLKSPASFKDEIGEPEYTKEELKLTKTLLDASLLGDFELGNYPDPYTDHLTEIIEAKVEGQEIVSVTEPEAPKVINLMEALKRSVADARKGARRPAAKKTRKSAAARSSKKMAPSARTATKRKKKSG
jgi:DNA end-binding protein Ku